VNCLRNSYYLAHRAERLAYSKSHRAERLVCQRRARLRKIGLYRVKGYVSLKRWRKANPDKMRAIRFAQYHFPLGNCCEFCGSKVGLYRFLVEYVVPVDFVVTVCCFCRSYVRKSLRVME
jgi:hypothetical protein